MKKFLLTLLGVLISLPTFARDFTYEYEGQTITYTVIDEDDKTVKTKEGRIANTGTGYPPADFIEAEGGNKVAGSLILPSNPKDGSTEYTLIEIGSSSFASCSELTSITIPNTVEILGSGAFAVTGLTSVTIPNSVGWIAPYAFIYCEELISISISESVIDIDEGAFMGCGGLEKAEFASIEALCNIWFRDETSNPLGIAEHLYINGEEITSVKIPDTVESIHDYTFFNCSGLTSVTIPNSVKKICPYAFYGCRGLTSINIPNSVMEICPYAFCGCRGLTSVIIPESVTKIWYDAFASCSGLKSVSLPNTIKEIDSHTFNNCSALTSIVIPNSVTSIGWASFYGCTALTMVEFGSSVNNISWYAFGESTSLEKIILPPSVKTIGDGAFKGDTKLESIIIGSNIKSIGENVFDGCPASKVYITAPEPPTAFDNTFSSYSGKLYVQDESSATLYRGASECWNKFSIDAMIVPQEITGNNDIDFSGKAGDRFQLSATIMPENVSLPQIFWRSTNPSIATVDNNGLVTLMTDIDNIFSRAGDEGSCKIIAESLYAAGPTLEYTVIDTTGGIEDINSDTTGADIDYTLPYEVFNLSGIRVSATTEGLTPGLYIIRQGKTAKKIMVK